MKALLLCSARIDPRWVPRDPNDWLGLENELVGQEVLLDIVDDLVARRADR